MLFRFLKDMEWDIQSIHIFYTEVLSEKLNLYQNKNILILMTKMT